MALGLSGMRAFTIIWIGQVLSLMGTAMTGFALTIWAWQSTGEATALALVGFFGFAPTILFSPIAGALVDRWNRKLVVMLADLGACIATIAILVLYSTGNLQIWHLYITGAFASVFQSFHFPAYSAAIAMMLPKDQYARASGMISMAQSASGIFAPVSAAALMGIIGISGIMTIDVMTCLFAVGMVLLVSIPNPPSTEEGRKGKGSIWTESIYGFRYIIERPSLLGLQLVFFAINLTSTFSAILFSPMILARTKNNQVLLGLVQSAGAAGGLIGGILLTTWGGPKRKVNGVLMGMVLLSLLGVLLTGLGRDAYLWALASFFTLLMIPIINGSNQAIWQAKVVPDVQGRVFAARLLIAQISAPVAMLLGGFMADNVFEPAMSPGGTLSSIFGGLVGTGPGAGMAVMFLITGILGGLIGLIGYAFREIRDAEDILPDHQLAKAAS